MQRIRFGMIGVGLMGQRHAENLRWRVPGATLIAVADASLERGRQVAAELEVEHVYDSVEALVARPDIDAVVIASPGKFHAAAIHAAAAAGKHILCEKPIALSLETADAALAAVEKAGVRLQIGHMRRFDPAYVSARKRIEAGEIGDPFLFKSLGRDVDCPPATTATPGVEGMLLFDSSIHDFDLARWLMNDEVAEVHTYAAVLGSSEQPPTREIDAGIINLRFVRGELGQVESFRMARYGYDIRTEIVGTKGTIQIGYLRQTAELVLTAAGARYDAVDHWLVRFADAYLAEMRGFVQMVETGRTPRVTGYDGRQALAISVAADRSYHESRAVAVSSQSARA